jgi:putative oxidoreductase
MRGFSSTIDRAITFDHARILRHAIAVLLVAVLVIIAWSYFKGDLAGKPADAVAFMAIWLALALVAILALPPVSFVAAFLVSLMCTLVGWRIAALCGITAVSYPLLVTFVLYLGMFAHIAWLSMNHRDPALRLDRTHWHETLIRIYIGFDLVPHFTEKLFAGPAPRAEDIKSFVELGVPSPDFFVTLAGFCELGIAIGIGLGILTRLASYCSALYFLVATILGHHFFLGFIWASPGGGWEYPLMMIVLLVCFALDGAGPFSLDGEILQRRSLPPWLRRVMVPRSD